MAATGSAWVIHSDGSAMPNPGRMGLGAVIVAPDGSRHTISRPAEGRGCNNEAELRALMAALQEARRLGAAALHVYSDSSIVVEQLHGTDAPPIDRLAPLFETARALLRCFDAVSMQWVPRHRNAEADALARAALGADPKRVASPARRRTR